MQIVSNNDAKIKRKSSLALRVSSIALGITSNDLSGLNDDQKASAIRKAAAHLLTVADELDRS